MKLFQTLNEEMQHTPAGSSAREYYIALGYRKNPAAAPTELRAAGVYSLFTETPVYIMPSDLIVGNQFCLYADDTVPGFNYLKHEYNWYRHRGFHENNDHYAAEFRPVLQGGVTGLLDAVAAARKAHAGDADRLATLDGMETTLRGFLDLIRRYADKAQALCGTAGYDDARLSAIANNCRALLDSAPQTFAQALQLVWFIHNAFRMEGRGAMALGRIDQYLYPFYQKDIENGIITNDDVVELLENVFIKLNGGDVINICLGGLNVDGSCALNGLSDCVLEAVKNCQVPGPNLSVRLTANSPDDFLDRCLQSIGTGLGYPALMNDDVNLAALSRYGYEKEDLYNYCMVGCIENFITGCQPPWSDGRFDTPRLFEYVFNRGVGKFNDTLGVDTGALEDIHTMGEFLSAFEKQFDNTAAEYYARFNNSNNGINQAYMPDPFLSCFCTDCIGRGLDINNGGAKYPSVHGVAVMGIGTMADAMAAIEKVAFVDKSATLAEIRDALNANFEGYEELREKLIAAPKYGNNDDFVDKYAVWLTDYAYKAFSRFKTRDGGAYYTCMAANVSNIYAGRDIGATPDGRLAGEPLSDAASPTYGRDVRGATASIHSLCKPDYTCVATGSVVNQKYSPAMFSDEKRAKLAAIIRTYFAGGGQEIQINATSAEVLRDAMDHPEKYQNLVVRVSGFSAYYVTLDRAVQLDILNRTQKDH